MSLHEGQSDGVGRKGKRNLQVGSVSLWWVNLWLLEPDGPRASLVFDGEANLERHLPEVNLAFVDAPASFDDLEPA